MERTEDSALFRLAYRAMCEYGVDVEEVFRRCGIPRDLLSRKDLRTPHEAQQRFWQTLEDVTGDPHIGLHLGDCLPVFKGQILEYLFLSSPTFGEGLDRALRYQRLISDATQGRLETDGDTAHLVIGPLSSDPLTVRHFSDAFTLGLLKFLRYVTEDHFQPLEVWLQHPAYLPLEDYTERFGCPVRLDQPENRVIFDAAMLAHPSAHHEPELLAAHEAIANRQVARLALNDIVAQVRRAIGEQLESGEVTLTRVAEQIGIKPRALRARLSEAGTSFNQILADYRCYLARRLLARTDESIDEIVYLTGFSEPSTFYRAFKRWVGMTPVEYRQAHRTGNSGP